jgi:urea transport system permease protein
MKGLDIKIERISLAVLALLMAVVLPMTLNGFYLNLIAKYASYAFVAIGIVLIWGFSGILSLGQGVFFGLGGYAMAMYLKLAAAPGTLPDFMTWSGVSSLPGWWVPFHSLAFAVAAGLLIPAVLAYVFSYLVFKKRVSGVYFAIVTLALALTFTVLLVGQQSYTGGQNGITNFSSIAGADMYSKGVVFAIYYLELVLLFGFALVALTIRNSRLGNVMLALRDREDRVRFTGYNTAAVKAFVFMLGALSASMGGMFFTIQAGLISPTVVGVTTSIEMVVFAAVGGRMSVSGAIVGALGVGLLEFYLSNNYPEGWLLLLGALFIVVVTVMPSGLMGLVKRLAMRSEEAAA